MSVNYGRNPGGFAGFLEGCEVSTVAFNPVDNLFPQLAEARAKGVEFLRGDFNLNSGGVIVESFICFWIYRV